MQTRVITIVVREDGTISLLPDDFFTKPEGDVEVWKILPLVEQRIYHHQSDLGCIAHGCP